MQLRNETPLQNCKETSKPSLVVHLEPYTSLRKRVRACIWTSQRLLPQNLIHFMHHTYFGFLNSPLFQKHVMQSNATEPQLNGYPSNFRSTKWRLHMRIRFLRGIFNLLMVGASIRAGWKGSDWVSTGPLAQGSGPCIWEGINSRTWFSMLLAHAR